MNISPSECYNRQANAVDEDPKHSVGGRVYRTGLQRLADHCVPMKRPTMTENDPKCLADNKEKSLASITVEDSSEMGCEISELGIDSTKDLFNKANQFIQPSSFFRKVVYLFAERKLMVFFFTHFAATMIIWFHFGLIKFEQQKSSVPDGAPFYWWKRIAPPLEFGSMHAILFQMALIPLTMSRYTISALSESIVDRFVPLNRMVRIHIHLGYVMVGIVFLATCFFFLFFGRLCIGDQQEFCDKFRTEIMCTGYGILASLLIVGGTSFFRHKIPYEVFYVVHHLVFALYAITVAHTFDNMQRSNRAERSQTFKWFSATLLYYICDRAAMHLNHKYRARVVAMSAVDGSSGSRMIILKLRRPVLFRFKPGQYAFLKYGKIDAHWHPFSIASGPSDSNLEFYIEVFGAQSWTGKLWKQLEGGGDGAFDQRDIELEIMGPYGTSLAKTDDFSHILSIGTGTGIVPILSLLKQHVRQIIKIDPEAHFKQLKEHQRRMLQVEVADEERKGSIAKQLTGFFRSHGDYNALQTQTKTDFMRESIRTSITKSIENDTKSLEFRRSSKELKAAAFTATKSIYGAVLLAILTVFGVILFSLTISWNTIPIDVYPGMIDMLQATTVLFQFCYAVVALFVWSGTELFAFLDLAVCFVTPAADVFWFKMYDDRGRLRPVDILTISLLTAYMTGRFWAMTVRPRHRSWKTGATDGCDRSIERLEVVWVTSSASLVSEILPDINDLWESVVRQWGYSNALKVCRISVYCTDKDATEKVLLERDLEWTGLFQQGFVHFGRPKFGEIIENHTIELIETRRSSYSLLAFCGSPQLATDIHRCKISNDMVTGITGHKKHQMDYVSESYGGLKPRRHAPNQSIEEPYSENDSRGMTTRQNTTFVNGFSRRDSLRP